MAPPRADPRYTYATMLAHETHGAGLDVVFLHSFPLDRAMWVGQLIAVGGARCRAVMVDLPGFGASPLPAGAAPTLDAYAHAVLATLDALGTQRAVFVGLSLGGYVALALAALAPARVAGLVLADTRASADDAVVRAGRIVNLALVRDRGVEALVERMLPNLVAPACPDAVRARVRSMAAQQSREGVAFALTAMRDRPDRTPLLATITAPTLVLVGEHDAITPPDEMRAMAGRIPGAQFAVIEGAGHLANIEQPARFNAPFEAFIAGLSAS